MPLTIKTISGHTSTSPALYIFLVCIFLASSILKTPAQSCPPNIDFEAGNFSGWTCYTGITSAVGDQNQISLNASSGPVYNRHTLYSGNTNELDGFGKFPVLCPNGSGNSIRLGNAQGGGQAEGISYEFTIPANANSFSLIYHYAVVFQAPNHRLNEQPRMEIEITNVTDNSLINCASFTFIAVGTSLPGFKVSSSTDTTAVLYKDWSAVTVDLSGNAGKTIRMMFKTADCTFRRHFGYAYIDVDSECSGSFLGATYCPDDSIVNVTAPFGYEGYTWYDSSLSSVIGKQQVLTITPAPRSGTTIAVKLVPYLGFGCPKTLYARLLDTLTVKSNAGADMLSCNSSPANIGTNPKTGWKYTWVPDVGLSDANIANPIATPLVTTAYVVQTKNSGGGCKTNDTVVVRASVIDTSIQLIGKASYCLDNNDSAILKVTPASSVQWYKNGFIINGAKQPSFKVNNSGLYHALLGNTDGCRINSVKQPIVIDKARPGLNYPVIYAIINTPLELSARPFGESFLWKPGTNLNKTNSFTTVFTGSTQRLYTIDIKTVAGCLTVDTQMVKTISGVELYVPTAFTPNSDGKNDYLRPILRGVKELRYFRVFNRWGNALYAHTKEQPGWDGVLNGVPQQTQTIVWMLECVGLDNVVYTRKGSTLLIR